MITRILGTYVGDLKRSSGPQKALIRSPGYARRAVNVSTCLSGRTSPLG